MDFGLYGYDSSAIASDSNLYKFQSPAEASVILEELAKHGIATERASSSNREDHKHKIRFQCAPNVRTIRPHTPVSLVLAKVAIYAVIRVDLRTRTTNGFSAPFEHKASDGPNGLFDNG
ncbi:hypothetical protein NP233_g12848 [Leucocoprinus birnbaumii]|uniref:Uncharacterized protein n=1 Tax=Leucocoprinus birnbaumii TaxID=56174 RepID=A0AAD5VDZ8_9AGAR|nr:hypothetical protein NP233_g12848 [Leucocoprinus birnbaumii]